MPCADCLAYVFRGALKGNWAQSYRGRVRSGNTHYQFRE
ncbi:MAG: peptidase [Gammaproteobacteria bacterium HGW-Gammaproteobacteria-12]|nr:MAG: peptidase [Gammaproteobacteria bacterium HGW-Gammaproteobacteria-12]